MNSTLVLNNTINTFTNKSNHRRRGQRQQQQQQAKKKKRRNRKLQLNAVIRDCYQRSSCSSSSYETDCTESLRLLPKQNLMPSLSLFSVPTISQVKSQSKIINEGCNTSNAVSPPPVPPPPLAPPLELKRNRSDSPTSAMQTFLFDRQEEEVEQDAHALFDKNLFTSTVLLPNLFDDADDYDNTAADEYYEDNYYYADAHFQEETIDIGTVPTPTAEMVGVIDPSIVATIIKNANSYVLDTTETFDDDIIVDDDVIIDLKVDADDDDIEIEPLPVFTARDAESIVQDMMMDDELSVPHYLVPPPPTTPTTMHTLINKVTIPNWSCHYQEIKNFQALYGHCDIPTTSTSTTVSNSYYQQLALWKKRQQFDYYQKEHHLPGGSNAMTLDRIMALEKIPGW
eukprot:CAMPEP_0170877604 /NCGR_PEP_ID=MMETSP0734-20130129/30431_1 /TAXON_ID=186038 /ORGANISM="Fragilariopsis kerguelensis, Strain L26-C5" /LENGTH=397 /DNA_ID=CAMNT_0011259953 /DNA_START=359 /DNA_END=1549 /DNA_ORIENTATION=-